MPRTGRPGGNPEFGTKYRFETDRTEPLRHKLTVKLAESMMEYLKTLGKDYPEFVREAIAEKIERHKATTETKTETTEPVTVGQQPENSQTSLLSQEAGTDPSQPEQAATPKTRRKASQSQEQKQEKPKTQNRGRKNNATEN